MKRLLAPLALAVVVLLAGCDLTVRPTPLPFDPPTQPRTATTDPSDPIDAGATLAPGGTAWYAVDVTDAVADAGDLLYIEADVGADGDSGESGAVQVRVYNPEGSVRATSAGASGFGAGEEPAPLAPAALESQAIIVTRTCLDACVIVPNAEGEVIVRVRNTSSVTRVVAVYAYAFEPQDSGEDANDALETAPTLSDFDTGAIETLGDEDIYRITNSGTLMFDSGSPLALRADVVFDDRVVTLEPGDTFDVRSGDYVVVYSAGNFAGPPSEEGSSYVLEVVD